jgi:hypothetical protein
MTKSVTLIAIGMLVLVGACTRDADPMPPNSEGMRLLKSLGDELRELRALPMSTPTNARCPNEVSPLNGYRQERLMAIVDGIGQEELLSTLGEPDGRRSTAWGYVLTSPVEPDQMGGGYPSLLISFGPGGEIVNITCSYAR